MNTTPYWILLFVHLSGLVLGFGSVMVTDLYGLLWIRDQARFPELVRVSGATGKFIWAGWGLMVAAGIPLLVLKGEIDNLLVVKLFFVALIGVNGVRLHVLHKGVRGYERGDRVPTSTLFALAFALFVSQLGWWGAMLIGFLHRQVQSIIEWPSSPTLFIALVLSGLLLLYGIGTLVIRRNQAAADELKDSITP